MRSRIWAGKVIWAVLALASVLANVAMAQSDGIWVNPTLSGQGIAGEQFHAMGRGHMAQCRAMAVQTAAAQPAQPAQQGGWRPQGFLAGMEHAQRQQQQQQLTSD